jgi:hypothetical protein
MFNTSRDVPSKPLKEMIIMSKYNMRFIKDKLFQAVREYHAIKTTQRIRRLRRTRTYTLPKQENAKFMRDEYIRMLMYQYAGKRIQVSFQSKLYTKPGCWIVKEIVRIPKFIPQIDIWVENKLAPVDYHHSGGSWHWQTMYEKCLLFDVHMKVQIIPDRRYDDSVRDQKYADSKIEHCFLKPFHDRFLHKYKKYKSMEDKYDQLAQERLDEFCVKTYGAKDHLTTAEQQLIDHKGKRNEVSDKARKDARDAIKTIKKFKPLNKDETAERRKAQTKKSQNQCALRDLQPFIDKYPHPKGVSEEVIKQICDAVRIRVCLQFPWDQQPFFDYQPPSIIASFTFINSRNNHLESVKNYDIFHSSKEWQIIEPPSTYTERLHAFDDLRETDQFYLEERKEYVDADGLRQRIPMRFYGPEGKVKFSSPFEGIANDFEKTNNMDAFKFDRFRHPEMFDFVMSIVHLPSHVLDNGSYTETDRWGKQRKVWKENEVFIIDQKKSFANGPFNPDYTGHMGKIHMVGVTDHFFPEHPKLKFIYQIDEWDLTKINADIKIVLDELDIKLLPGSRWTDVLCRKFQSWGIKMKPSYFLKGSRIGKQNTQIFTDDMIDSKLYTIWIGQQISTKDDRYFRFPGTQSRCDALNNFYDEQKFSYITDDDQIEMSTKKTCSYQIPQFSTYCYSYCVMNTIDQLHKIVQAHGDLRYVYRINMDSIVMDNRLVDVEFHPKLWKFEEDTRFRTNTPSKTYVHHVSTHDPPPSNRTRTEECCPTTMDLVAQARPTRTAITCSPNPMPTAPRGSWATSTPPTRPSPTSYAPPSTRSTTSCPIR